MENMQYVTEIYCLIIQEKLYSKDFLKILQFTKFDFENQKITFEKTKR